MVNEEPETRSYCPEVALPAVDVANHETRRPDHLLNGMPMRTGNPRALTQVGACLKRCTGSLLERGVVSTC